MKYLLSREHDDVLAQLGSSRVLVAFDFDGTLAPIVSDRDEAWMRPETLELFSKVCDLYPCAVISGRGRADVHSRLGSARVEYVVGNHGLEPGAGLEKFEAEMARARALLEESLGGLAGLDIEDKRYSLAIHYRRSRSKRLARAAIAEAVAVLPVRVRLVPGWLVANIVPERAPNKGDALLALRSTAGADAALYVGDDVTDEDVFVLDEPGRLLTVRVGESLESAAAYFLRDQHEMDRLLEKLVAMREGHAPE
jgi:trehalose 6-phosphate phosphatase